MVEIVGGRRRWSRPLTQRVIRPTLHFIIIIIIIRFFLVCFPSAFIFTSWLEAEAQRGAETTPRRRFRGGSVARSGRSAPRPLRSFRATAAPDGRPRTAPLHFPIDDSIHYRTPDCRGNPRSKESSGADSLDNQLRAMVMK